MDYLLPAVRKNKIKQLLLENKNVTVVELSDKFSVSEETIRRDLKALENEGVAKRTHGGAVLAERVSGVVNTNDLKNIFVESKRTISKLARPLVKNGDCIFLDSSTTSYYVSDGLKDMQLTVVTNSLDILTKLSRFPNINLIAVGGNLSRSRKCFVGINAIKILQNYYFDIALLSCRTLSLSEGVTDSNDEEAEIKRLVSERTRNLVLMADYSKFNKVSFTKVFDLNIIDYLITDKPLNNEWIEYMETHQIAYLDTTQKESDEVE